MELRKRNNEIKRDFLQKWVRPGSSVLDVGCGQGGDIHKWRHIGISKLVGVDPNERAIEEARRRSQGYGRFFVGDIRSVDRDERFDVVCYNFSLQYQSLDLVPEITGRLIRNGGGGLLIGIITDSTRLSFGKQDGIHITKVSENRIRVFIPNTPYYANGPITEPLLDKDTFIQCLESHGLKMILWEPFSIYAKFVFQYQE